MEKNAKIYVAGSGGMVGSAIVRKLKSSGYTNLLQRTSTELDLRNQKAVEDFFAAEQPEYLFLAAAKVGGILANNTYRADFIYNVFADGKTETRTTILPRCFQVRLIETGKHFIQFILGNTYSRITYRKIDDDIIASFSDGTCGKRDIPFLCKFYRVRNKIIQHLVQS